MTSTGFARLIKRIKAFFSPLSGWAERVRLYRTGNVIWAVTGRPELPPTAPWPTEWTVVDFAPAMGGGVDMTYPDTVSDVSGREAKGEDAVRCARCGIHLHVAEAGMQTNIDIPACSWCVGFVRRA